MSWIQGKKQTKGSKKWLSLAQITLYQSPRKNQRFNPIIKENLVNQLMER